MPHKHTRPATSVGTCHSVRTGICVSRTGAGSRSYLNPRASQTSILLAPTGRARRAAGAAGRAAAHGAADRAPHRRTQVRREQTDPKTRLDFHASQWPHHDRVATHQPPRTAGRLGGQHCWPDPARQPRPLQLAAARVVPVAATGGWPQRGHSSSGTAAPVTAGAATAVAATAAAWGRWLQQSWPAARGNSSSSSRRRRCQLASRAGPTTAARQQAAA